MLEPEPPEEVASNEDPTWDEGESGGGEQAGGAEGEGAADGEAGAEGELAGSPGGGAPAGADDGEEALGGQPAGASGQPGGQVGDEAGAVASGGVPVGGLPAGEGGGLDRELNQSLEVFDEEMQRRITILASARGNGEEDSGGGGQDPERGEQGEGGGPFDQTGEGSQLVLVDGDPSRLPGGENAGTDSGADGEGEVRVVNAGNRGLRGGVARDEAYPRVPADVGDGSDDDVVARQIREAALNEADPVLREKLWQEYRNYKKSIR